jgi:S-DNA-T family DNA segregation ATPase FtsK/SpoIIIE
MATKKKKQSSPEPTDFGPVFAWTGSVLVIALGLILLLGGAGIPFHVALAGDIGNVIFTSTYREIGLLAYVLPLVLILIGVSVLIKRSIIKLIPSVGIAILMLSFFVFFGITTNELGGSVGVLSGIEAVKLFGFWGSLILLLAIALVGLGLLTDVLALFTYAGTKALTAGNALGNIRLGKRINEDGSIGEVESNNGAGVDLDNIAAAKAVAAKANTTEEAAAVAETKEPTITLFNRNQQGADGTEVVIPSFDAEYNPPPISLLIEDKGKPGVGDIKANANIIKRTFINFGISVEMDEVSVGPTVTRYAIKPAEGVRLSKIISLQNNLELALAAHPVRIEAPIPGKSLVGIEVPNASKAMVGLGGVLSAPEWSTSSKPILAAIGRDITGTPHYVNIAKMPHGLIAGATGSGKSVAIHAVITSLLYRNSPNNLRFIMVDPKRVELTLYNGIPHLLTPVITDAKKCIMSLKWAAKEMDRRYGILEEKQVRDIDSYHKTIVEPAKKRNKAGSDLPEAMPYIVIVIDELADIMQMYPRELEASIVRLAQMSRAVGIHLILSTQRPSVNVITGLIKANVPTRMALQVASQIDSRTILDQGGAESLLGAGDMLYLASDMQKPVRIQTAYISENEVKKVVQYIKDHNVGSIPSVDLGTGGISIPQEPNDTIMHAFDQESDDDSDDDLYQDAKAAVEEAGRASTSYLQRKLRIGYSRAARLMDILEDKGVIGPADGSRPREILSQVSAGNTESNSSENGDLL